MGGKIVVVAGAQFGSEGKGAVAAQLSKPEVSRYLLAVRVAGPNAGHTVVGTCPPGCEPDETNHVVRAGLVNRFEHLWKLRSVPVAAVVHPSADLIIAAGSEVDLSVLESEVTALDAAGYDVSGRLTVDQSATVLTPEHIKTEQASDLVKRLGSTAKGIGAARADRIWRTAGLFGGGNDTVPYMYDHLGSGATVLIEGTQGYGLGTHAGLYPQCTSSDCRAIDFLAMAGLSPWHSSVDGLQVWLAARVRPIRVAGNSGPLRGETTWDALGLPEERTTVTNKVRRVGEWDADLVASAVMQNGGGNVSIGLTMVDTLIPELTGIDDPRNLDNGVSRKLIDLTGRVNEETGGEVHYIGTGPDTGFFI